MKFAGAFDGSGTRRPVFVIFSQSSTRRFLRLSGIAKRIEGREVKASSCLMVALLAASTKVFRFLDLVGFDASPEMGLSSKAVLEVGSCSVPGPGLELDPVTSSRYSASILKQATRARGGYFLTFGFSLAAGGSLGPDRCRSACAHGIDEAS